jgi:hypothetical protein
MANTTDGFLTEKIEENESEDQNLYYQNKKTKAKVADIQNTEYKQKRFFGNKRQDKDRRHGKEKK